MPDRFPLDRLLLETDAPAEPNIETSAQSLIKSLTRTSMRIASLKNCDAKRIEWAGSQMRTMFLTFAAFANP